MWSAIFVSTGRLASQQAMGPEHMDHIQTKISSPGGKFDGVQVPALRTSLALTPSTRQGPQKRVKPQLDTNRGYLKSPAVPIGAHHPQHLVGEHDLHPRDRQRGLSSSSIGEGTATSAKEWPVVNSNTQGLEHDRDVPLRSAEWGTMASPIGPIVVNSNTPPSLRGLSEQRVKKNLFAAGPINPIVEQLQAENCRVGPSNPDPHNHLGPAREAVTLM